MPDKPPVTWTGGEQSTDGKPAGARPVELPRGIVGLRAQDTATPWRAWLGLSLILIAELLTTIHPTLGLMLHAVLLVGVLIYGAMGRPGPERDLVLGLSLAPLLRLLSLSLPLAAFPRLLWYPLVMLPLMNAARIAARTSGLSREDLGLRADNLALQLMAAPVGLGIGVIEYLVLRPPPLVPGDTWGMHLVAALTLIILVGFGEELVFRGLLLPLAQFALEGWGIVFVSLLFAILHIGYGSLADVLLAFGLSVLLALFVNASHSILGVSLAHGLANVTLLLVMPQIAHGPSFGVVAAALLGCSMVAGAVVVWKLRRLGSMDGARDHGPGKGIRALLLPPTTDRAHTSGLRSEATDLQPGDYTDERKDER